MILVATPYTKPIMGGTIDSLIHAKNPCPLQWERLFGWSVDDARNKFAEMVLESDFTKLLFVDSDAKFDAEAITRLYERDLPIVCGTMFTAELPPKPTMAHFRGKKDKLLLYNAAKISTEISKYAETHKLTDTIPNAITFDKSPDDIVEIDGCGMHFTMIDRKVLEAIEPPLFLMGGETGAGEDFYFCRKAKEAGFKVYWDKSVYTEHLLDERDHGFGLREFLVFDQIFSSYEAMDWMVEDADNDQDT